MSLEIIKLISMINSSALFCEEETLSTEDKTISFKELLSFVELKIKPAIFFNLNDLSIFNSLEVGQELSINKDEIKLKIEGIEGYGK